MDVPNLDIPAYQDPAQPLELRIDDLLSRMTLEEKIDCLGTNPSVPRLGVRGSDHIEGLHGVALGEPGGWGGANPIPTTTFPQAIGLGQTWDLDLIRRAAAVEGYEARYLFQCERYQRGGIVVRAPNADLGRDPRWGRTEECFGEDPYFNGVMTQAFVRGLQGDHPDYWLCASLMKHFLANSNENGRENSSSDFDERLFREYYSAPFRMGIEAGSRAFMAAYNAYNGVPCAVHPMLKEIAVNEWGQDGVICTDGGAMKLLISHHKWCADDVHAVAAIVKAGIGQFLDDYIPGAQKAVESKLLTEAEIDAALRGDFRVMVRLGLLDPPASVPYSQIGAADEPEPWLSESHRAVAREATEKSIVLLKNEGGVLPLDPESLRSVALIGPRADAVLLDWYSGSPPYAVTPLQGLRERLGQEIDVRFADGEDIEAAAELARECEVSILCLGNNPVGSGGWAKVNTSDEGREAVDRETLNLCEAQEKLLRQVYAANPNTILVLISSFPYAILWAQEHVPAIVQMTHSSQEQGNALAAALVGDINPAGRLVQTWPRSIEQLPAMMDYDIRHGRTYLYGQADTLYPFGYGLSYTSFAYSDLQVSSRVIGPNDSVDVSVCVANVGPQDGEEVVQLYVRHAHSQVQRPQIELKGFQRVAIRAGETKTITISLSASQFAYWNSERGAFVVEPGPIQILVGGSSANIIQEATIIISD
ncbi:MAG: glycoside hydrolase family 3 C-terminal domain-containing protein [Capsulimonas sp.]|uniref:glycoside hydrolase family 3 C-terminal domain-containing protein n=1 Tax=Capsulimonas sp. TaxID=2494211 RepID=UPI003265D6DA